MWGRFWTPVVLVFITIIYQVSCDGQSSLAFVIDDTFSMSDDIRQVKQSVNKIMDIVFYEKASLIKNLVLVTINDPDSILRTVTASRSVFLSHLNAVNVNNYNNVDCPEMSMKGIITALENSLPGSYLYVFTDASSKDYLQKYVVIELCQRKQSQIVFIITGYCWDYDKPSFQVYYEIAAACSGLVFFMHKDYVEQIFTPIGENIIGNKTLLARATVPAGKREIIKFTVDDYTDYVIASASGDDADFVITGYFKDYKKLMWNYNGKVYKLIGTSPGEYEVSVKGKTDVSVIVFGRTDFVFKHGFSELKPKSQKDTTPQPTADAKVYLSIFVTDPKEEVKIKTANIYQDGKLKYQLPLTKVSKDFYITQPFVAPSRVFQLGVTGEVKTTGKTITRMSAIPITPQKPLKKLPDKTKPSAVITEGNSIQIDYDSTVTLTCKVRAYPKPQIKWFNSEGKSLDSMFQTRLLQAPYEYISYLTISNSKKADKYTCYAVNNLDKDSKTIEVIVKDAFTVKSIPNAITNVDYGSKGTIVCDIKSKIPMSIHWFFINEITGENGEILSGPKYKISADRTQLEINKMDLDLAGRYICKAFLTKDESVQKTYRTLVKVTGLVQPKLSGLSEQKAIKGTSIQLECKIDKGVPKPTITWQFMEQSSSKFIDIVGSDNILRLPDVKLNQAGRYKCVATNVVGKDEHTTTLFVQELPKIITSPTTYETIEGKEVLTLLCASTGLPKPEITWFSGIHPVTPNAKFSIKDGSLIIKHPEVTDSNIYKCVAKNDAGLDNAVFTVNVLQTPKLRGDALKKVILGSSADITCMIAKGVPKPTITWQMKNKDGKWDSIPQRGEKLVFKKVAEKDAGQYKCVAENKAGTDEHVTTVIVESPPTITSDVTALYEGVEGDVALRIPCDVIGNPQPKIVWKFKDSIITPNSKYRIEDGALIILKPNVNDTASYTCKAENHLGAVSATFKASVTETLEKYGTLHNIYLLHGETKKLECGTYRSKSQSIVWYIEGLNISESKPYITIDNPTTFNDGNYTCRMTDIHGHTETHTYVVDVGYKPALKEKVPLDDWSGDINDILVNCQSSAKPDAEVVWKINGTVFSNMEFIQQLENNVVWGQYTCNVSNVHGSVQRTFDVKSSSCFINKHLETDNEMPLILTNKLTWPEWESTKDYLYIKQNEEFSLSCPNHNGKPNGFKLFPGQNTINMVCEKQDSFSVDGKTVKISDLRCSNGIDISLVKKDVKCLSDNSELIIVGYNVGSFLKTYEVCYDSANFMPLYSKVMISKTDEAPNKHLNWYKYPELGDAKIDNGLTCKGTLSSCCYGKAQLVHSQDFVYGPAKNTTFIEPLNAVTYWRPCDPKQTTWDKIHEMVTSQLNNYDQFLSWSGVHTLQKIKETIVPRYLWKVLRFDEEDAIAIIHVNDPSPTKADIKCTDICTEIQFWFTRTNNYTYCCSVSDFLNAFDLADTDVGGPMEEAL